MTTYILLSQETDNLTTARCEAVAGVLRRLHSNTAIATSYGDVRNTIQMLRNEGQLAVVERDDRTELYYVPSQAAQETILDESIPWPPAIAKRHANVLRRSNGAIFTLPFENGDGALEAFITDWSPFPAAVALAVHVDHPLAYTAGRRNGSFFTGRFVRHPLTGDLLPVWVAPFVLPEFGTGVVIVNPAHSEADLAVARTIGMPVRFGLAHTPVTSDPTTWPHPPVIKTGVTVRTGPYDGLSIHEAIETYFKDLSERGAARRTVCYGVGKTLIATFSPSPSGDTAFDTTHLRWLDPTDAPDLPTGELVPTAMLSVVGQLGATEDAILVTSSGLIESSLLFTRLLYRDLHKKTLDAGRIQLVHGAAAPKNAGIDDLPQSMLHLVLLACADPGDQASVKVPTIEQAQRFKEVHQMIVDELYGEIGDEAITDDSLVRDTVQALHRSQFKTAFDHLYKLQKTIKNTPATHRSATRVLPTYFALAAVLANYEIPAVASGAANTIFNGLIQPQRLR